MGNSRFYGNLSEVNRKYYIAYIDPPWRYKFSTHTNQATNHYHTMSDDEIFALPVKSIMHDWSVAFVWATGPRLETAIRAIRAWGLHFRGVAFVWVKTKADGTPMGARGVRPSIVKSIDEFVLAASSYTEDDEYLLSASGKADGRPLELKDESVKQNVFAPPSFHSEKPHEARERIVRLYGDIHRIELFARSKPDGWDTWGNE